jgi:hypothetical protein
LSIEDIEHQASSLGPGAQRELSAAVVREGYRTGEDQRTEFILGPTASFRKLIETYLATVAPMIYEKKDLTTVRNSIGTFFRFLVTDLQIDDLELIRPSTVTRYIEFRSQLGYTSFNFLGHLSSFFLWLTSTGRYDRGNPVVNRFHRERVTEMRISTSTRSRADN